MEDNVFAAFSFSGASRNGAAPGSGASLAKLGNSKKGQGYRNKAPTHSRGSGASHVVAPPRRVRVKVTDEISGEGLGVSAVNSDVRGGGGNFTSAPKIQISGPRHQSLAKGEKWEATAEEEPSALPELMCASQAEEENHVQGDYEGRGDIKVKEEYEVKRENHVPGEIQFKEENQISGEFRVKEESQDTEKPVSAASRKKLSHWNTRNEDEICDEIEDVCGGKGMRCPRADSIVLEVKKVTTKRQSTKVVKGTKGSSAGVHPPPPNWEEAIQNIRTMRTSRDAPVDLLGPAQLVDPNADSETQKFHVLVAAMISSQTRDAVTAAAMKRLHALPGGLTVNHLAETVLPTEKMEELLKPVGFYRQKAKQLKSMAEILVKPPYCGAVPRTLDELMKLPGVGPKVGLLVLWVGFGMGEVGLIVDTNVRRVCCRLGWAPEGSCAEQVRHELESWLPKDLWAEASFLLVGFGQQVCKPIGPNCKECQLQNFCPSAFKCVKKITAKKKSS